WRRFFAFLCWNGMLLEPQSIWFRSASLCVTRSPAGPGGGLRTMTLRFSTKAGGDNSAIFVRILPTTQSQSVFGLSSAGTAEPQESMLLSSTEKNLPATSLNSWHRQIRLGSHDGAKPPAPPRSNSRLRWIARLCFRRLRMTHVREATKAVTAM